MPILEIDINKHVAKIILNRPDKINVLNRNLLDLMSFELDKIANDPTIRVVVIYGQGNGFCAGADLNELLVCDAISGYSYAKHGQLVFNKIANLGKPVIAAVHGVALGGGCELALAANIRIASETAKFAQPEIKLGLIPGFAGTQRLARYIGKSRALDLCLTGKIIDAKTALHWGLISDITDNDKLFNFAETLAHEISQLPPIAINSIIKIIDEGYDLSLHAAQELEATHFAKVCATSDKNIGINGFLNKTKPIFLGK